MYPLESVELNWGKGKSIRECKQNIYEVSRLKGRRLNASEKYFTNIEYIFLDSSIVVINSLWKMLIKKRKKGEDDDI